MGEENDESDLHLHGELCARERIDAILSSNHMTTDQAVRALNANYRESQDSFPHVIVASVDVDGGVQIFYFGPFEDRRHAEEGG
jgi:hypothetical protein